MYYARVCVFALLSKQENNISYGSCTLDAETLAARQNETRQPMNTLEVVSLLAIASLPHGKRSASSVQEPFVHIACSDML